MMRWALILAIIMLLLGIGCLKYASQFPVYTDADAPLRLSRELRELPREERFTQWYECLETYETPHKHYADLGRGLIALGLGLLAACSLLYAYIHWPRLRNFWIIVAMWLGLWALRFPLSVRYYSIRQHRFDYPVWGDSIAIPIWMESISWIILGALTTLAILLLQFRYILPASLKVHRPTFRRGQIRFGLILLWILSNLYFASSGAWYGDEGTAFTCMVASAILYLQLASQNGKAAV